MIVQGDSFEILPTLEVGSFDVVVTSPPYNIGTKYSSHDDGESRHNYLIWTRSWLNLVKRVLASSGSFFLNVGGKPTDPWPPYEVLGVAREAGFVLQNTIFWIKSLSEDGGPVEGHVKPINSERFVNDAVEFVFHLTHRGDVELDKLALGVPYADEANLKRGTRGKHGNIRCRGNAWVVPYRTIQSRAGDRPHPATFPPALAENCFKLHGLSKIKKTLDPFAGIGSTAVAAARLGLDHLSIEIDAGYAETARQRLGQPAAVVDPATDF